MLLPRREAEERQVATQALRAQAAEPAEPAEPRACAGQQLAPLLGAKLNSVSSVDCDQPGQPSG